LCYQKYFKKRRIAMHTDLEVAELTSASINDIMVLERRVCIPLIQASEETILRRFSVGNIMLGTRLNGALVGSIGFRYGCFDPENKESFVRNFKEFSTPSERPTVFNSGFIYSVNVDPAYRALAVQPKTAKLHAVAIGWILIVHAVERMKALGCAYAVGDGRPAFYNGSHGFLGQEYYEQIPRLKYLLDKAGAGHTLSNEESKEILSYSIFRAYDRFLGGGTQLAWVLPSFFPTDLPTGGFRVILYKTL
jgi:hypothetical protein